MENMAYEIVDLIKDEYGLDKSLVADCMFFLKETTTDSTLIKLCEQTMEDLGYCPIHNIALETREVRETHWELDDHAVETWIEEYCPICGD